MRRWWLTAVVTGLVLVLVASIGVQALNIRKEHPLNRQLLSNLPIGNFHSVTIPGSTCRGLPGMDFSGGLSFHAHGGIAAR
jgi:hypothetical protein